MASLELLEGRMQYAPTAYRQEAFFLMVDWGGQANVSGKTCFLGSSFLPLMEEKKAKEDQGLYRGRGSWPGTGSVRNVTGKG